MKEIELTEDERKTLGEMLESPGWKIAEKVAKFAESQALEICGEITQDHRFYQGILVGIRGSWLYLASKVTPEKAAPEKKEDSYA